MKSAFLASLLFFSFAHAECVDINKKVYFRVDNAAKESFSFWYGGNFTEKAAKLSFNTFLWSLDYKIEELNKTKDAEHNAYVKNEVLKLEAKKSYYLEGKFGNITISASPIPGSTNYTRKYSGSMKYYQELEINIDDNDKVTAIWGSFTLSDEYKKIIVDGVNDVKGFGPNSCVSDAGIFIMRGAGMFLENISGEIPIQINHTKTGRSARFGLGVDKTELQLVCDAACKKEIEEGYKKFEPSKP